MVTTISFLIYYRWLVSIQHPQQLREARPGDPTGRLDVSDLDLRLRLSVPLDQLLAVTDLPADERRLRLSLLSSGLHAAEALPRLHSEYGTGHRLAVHVRQRAVRLFDHLHVRRRRQPLRLSGLLRERAPAARHRAVPDRPSARGAPSARPGPERAGHLQHVGHCELGDRFRDLVDDVVRRIVEGRVDDMPHPHRGRTDRPHRCGSDGTRPVHAVLDAALLRTVLRSGWHRP